MAKKEVNKLIFADDLKIGMYLAKLDRPWIGTPFLFQGFPIEDEKQITQVKALCHLIYVDVIRSEPRLVPEIHAAALRASSLRSQEKSPQAQKLTPNISSKGRSDHRHWIRKAATVRQHLKTISILYWRTFVWAIVLIQNRPGHWSMKPLPLSRSIPMLPYG